MTTTMGVIQLRPVASIPRYTASWVTCTSSWRTIARRYLHIKNTTRSTVKTGRILASFTASDSYIFTTMLMSGPKEHSRRFSTQIRASNEPKKCI